MPFFTKDTKSAYEARSEALRISFGPVVFQSARVLRNSGILETLEKAGPTGLPMAEVVERVGLPPYGVRVLLESGLSIGLVTLAEARFRITKTGLFLLHDELTRVNMDFVHDVCYRGLFSLDKSIETGRPEGLKEFGDWNTIYEGLAQLPPPVQKSWFGFDHFFSDRVFPSVLPLVFKHPPRRLLDVGGNTGKWAIACTRYHPDVAVTILDLPGQLTVAQEKIEAQGLSDRVSFLEGNLLDETQAFPPGYDAIWMSQFLDCFSETEITSILKRAAEALDDEGRLFILEAFWDRQPVEVAAFCLHHTSLYFTALANGNSQMYHSEPFARCLEEAGFEIAEQVDGIILSHTLLVCKKKSIVVSKRQVTIDWG